MRLSGINGCETIVVKCYTLSDQVLQTTTKEKEQSNMIKNEKKTYLKISMTPSSSLYRSDPKMYRFILGAANVQLCYHQMSFPQGNQRPCRISASLIPLQGTWALAEQHRELAAGVTSS